MSDKEFQRRLKLYSTVIEKQPNYYIPLQKCFDAIESMDDLDNIFIHTMAPTMVAYVSWVLKEASYSGIKRLYFLARDGYMMYQTALKLKEAYDMPLDIRYLKVSRYSMRMAEYVIQGNKALDTICVGGIDVSFRKMLERAAFSIDEITAIAERIGLENDINCCLNYRQIINIKSKLEKEPMVFECIAKRSSEAYKTAVSYLAQEGLFEDVPYALVDSGWVGTLQMSIQNIVNNVCHDDRRLKGYYFGLYERPEGTLIEQYKAFFFDKKQIRRKVRFSNCLFEAVFSAPEGMTLGYEVCGSEVKPVISQAGNPNVDYIVRFSELLDKYTSHFIEANRNFGYSKKSALKMVERLLSQMMGRPTQTEAELLGKLSFCDDVLESQMQPVAAKWDSNELKNQRFINKILIKTNKKEATLHDSAWPEGTITTLQGNVKKNLRQERAYKWLMYIRKAVSMLALVLIMLFAGVVQVDAATAVVEFGSENYEKESGETFPIGVYIRTPEGTGAYEVSLSYDPRGLKYVSGADFADEDAGLLILSGTEGENRIRYWLQFTAISGGESTLRVNNAQVLTKTFEVYEIEELDSAPVKVSGEDVRQPIVETPSQEVEKKDNDEQIVITNPDNAETSVGETVDIDINDDTNKKGAVSVSVIIILVLIIVAVIAFIISLVLIIRKNALDSDYSAVFDEKKSDRKPDELKSEKKKPIKPENRLLSDKKEDIELIEGLEIINFNDLEEGLKSEVSSIMAEEEIEKTISVQAVINETEVKENVEEQRLEKLLPIAEEEKPEAVAEKQVKEIEAVQENKEQFVEKPVKKKKRVINVDDVTMEFKIASSESSGIKEYIIRFLKREITYRKLYALYHVSFDVYKGEVVGIIGTNGSGKSTILKIVSGALKPTSGKVTVDRSKVQLLTLGTGFDTELTGRENVYLNGAIIGYSKAFLDEHYDEIVEFAELQDFMDEKVKNYSSGMVSRLGFAIATAGDAAEILILDEVLSVGDEFFRKKSLKRVKEMIHGGSTVLMVSHNMSTIIENCSKCVWIEKGELKMVGEPIEVCKAYQNMQEKQGA